MPRRNKDEVTAATSDFPKPPPGCRWMAEGPDGSLIDVQQLHDERLEEAVGEEASSDDEEVEASALQPDDVPKELLLHPQLLESRRRYLLASCEAAGDTICSMGVNRQLQKQPGNHQSIKSVLAVGASDDVCRLFDVSELPPATEEEHQLAPAATIEDAKDSVSSVGFSADGLLLACGSFDGCVRVYGITAAAKAVLLEELKGPSEGIAALAFHPRGYALLAASEDQTAWVWLLPPSWGAAAASPAPAVKPAVTLSVFAASSPLTCCAFSGSGTRCIVGGTSGALSLFAARDGASFCSFTHPTSDPQAKAAETQGPVNPRRSSSSSRSGVEDSEGGAMEVDEAEPGEAVVCVAVDASHNCCFVGYEDGYLVALSEESGKILLCGKSEVLFFSGGLDGKIRLWQLSKKIPKLTIDCTITPLSPDPSCRSGGLLADSSGDADGDDSSEEGVIRMLLHPELPLLLAGTSFGLLRAYDCRSSNSGLQACCDMWTAHPHEGPAAAAAPRGRGRLLGHTLSPSTGAEGERGRKEEGGVWERGKASRKAEKRIHSDARFFHMRLLAATIPETAPETESANELASWDHSSATTGWRDGCSKLSAA
ncbi:wd g-beta repeat-containing protein [Cyclospora cayetanensis]|uniref:Wd g-beta repeat-containing protein n=1 Tax=Cyclospora cayetanensis TaxID=88456 RepID=A0A1D3CTH4_9EIME|nr:wd g-beta repeat-containing protein [Cyclospora cayetanensis]